MRPGRGNKGLGIFGVDPAFDRVPAEFDGPDHVRQFFARREANLRFHQVHAGHHFRDRMLHLNARVHFDEVELARVIAQKLHGAGARIADLSQRFHHLIADSLPRFRVERRRGRLLQHLLVTPLKRAFALAEMDHVAVAVAQHLKFDVPGALDELLHVDVGAAKGLLGFGASGLKRRDQLLFLRTTAHAASAAAFGRLDHQREADLAPPISLAVASSATTPGASGNDRQPRCGHLRARAVLFAHHADDVGRRADKGDVRSLADFGEIGVLGKKAVAGMDGVDVGDLRGADDLRDVQVALAAARRPDADRLVRKAHVQGIAVRLGIYRDGLHAQFLARA